MMRACGKSGALVQAQAPAPRAAQLRRATVVVAAKADALGAAPATTSASAADNGTKATTPTSMMDFDELADIIRMVDSTDIVELELKSKRFSLAVRKREALKVPEPVQMAYNGPQYYPPPQQQSGPPPAAAPAPAAAAAAPAPAAAAPAAPALGGIEVTSPMSGTFYRLPAPGEPPFVKEGDMVKKGQTIGIIEAMKLLNEIEAEVSGEVIKFCVENGKTVATGQVLLIVRPT